MSRSSAVVFNPRNRLSHILTATDRSGFVDHVRHAEQALGHLTPAMAKALDEQIQSLDRLCRGEEAEVFVACRDIGLAALTVVESARLAGRPDVADTAEGVWEMIDALSTRGVWHTDALRVHADALIALSSDTVPSDQSATIISELRRLRLAIGVQRSR